MKTILMMMIIKCAKIFSLIMMLMLMAIFMVHVTSSSSVVAQSSKNPWIPKQPLPLTWIDNQNKRSSRVVRATISASPIPVAPKPTAALMASTKPVTAAAIVPIVPATIVPVVQTFQPQFLAAVPIVQPIAMASNNNQNFFTLSSVQRRRHTIRYQAPKGSSKNSTLNSPSEAPEEIAKPQTINVPIGVSHYKPIQFVDSLQAFQQPTDYKAFIESFNEVNKNTTSNNNKNNNKSKSDKDKGQTNTAKRQTNKQSTTSSSEPESKNISNEIKLVETASGGFVPGGSNPGFIHKPRMIELESSYIPLTLRFSSRPRRLNIISNEDLIGQDSNRHDRINGKSEPIDLIDKNSGFFNLDTRSIFGPVKREEPLVLKAGANNVPSNMQHIIKCIFPDFRFDGSEKIRSAC
uniref:Uncharacterized protein LOC113797966 n=1 Tax=Dermatophagoides pteronyssinus TaxID=6956 RepID=A0A6P6YG57_DERPT|nr:uncharacterized protein LOC113797966 [Dermatophagoides pteronyssinus]